MEKLIINGTTIEKGSYNCVNFNIARLPTHTIIDLPVYVYRGPKSGPILLLTAGLHGDEINGIEIIRKLMVKKCLFPEKGTVIAMPLVNIYGFLNMSRVLPDGKDLNRSFPGSDTGSLANRIAYVISNEIIPIIDYGVDYHTGGANKSNYPQIRCTFDNETNLKLASYFNPPFILNSKLIDKSFRKEADKQGKSVIVYEGGESMRIDDLAVESAVNGTLRLMKALGMVSKSNLFDDNKVQGKMLPKTSWKRAKTPGIFRSSVKYGEFVNKNKVLGYITDPFGEKESRVTATNSGYIVGINHTPVVNSGDALFHIGSED